MCINILKSLAHSEKYILLKGGGVVHFGERRRSRSHDPPAGVEHGHSSQTHEGQSGEEPRPQYLAELSGGGGGGGQTEWTEWGILAALHRGGCIVVLIVWGSS